MVLTCSNFVKVFAFSFHLPRIMLETANILRSLECLLSLLYAVSKVCRLFEFACSSVYVSSLFHFISPSTCIQSIYQCLPACLSLCLSETFSFFVGFRWRWMFLMSNWRCRQAQKVIPYPLIGRCQSFRALIQNMCETCSHLAYRLQWPWSEIRRTAQSVQHIALQYCCLCWKVTEPPPPPAPTPSLRGKKSFHLL